MPYYRLTADVYFPESNLQAVHSALVDWLESFGGHLDPEDSLSEGTVCSTSLVTIPENKVIGLGKGER